MEHCTSQHGCTEFLCVLAEQVKSLSVLLAQLHFSPRLTKKMLWFRQRRNCLEILTGNWITHVTMPMTFTRTTTICHRCCSSEVTRDACGASTKQNILSYFLFLTVFVRYCARYVVRLSIRSVRKYESRCDFLMVCMCSNWVVTMVKQLKRN